jgi:hypothetical protein
MSPSAPARPESPLSLPATAAALGTDALAATLARELPPLLATHPALVAATEQGGRIDPGSIGISLLGQRAAGDGNAELRIGVCCEESVGGCSCGDAPYTSRLYCELLLTLAPDGRAKIGPGQD